MGGNAGWLTETTPVWQRTGAGVIDGDERIPWREVLTRAQNLADQLPRTPHGWVVPGDASVTSVIGMLAAGLAANTTRWMVGAPPVWATDKSWGEHLWEAGPQCDPPPGTEGTTYATSTSGSTGRPKLLFGRPESLPAAVELYDRAILGYEGAEVFAACGGFDFTGVFLLVLLPAMLTGRDLLLFRPNRWDTAAQHLAGRPGVLFASAALTAFGAPAGEGRDFSQTVVIPAAGGLTADRAERISAGFRGCQFLNLLGATEAGIIATTTDVDRLEYVGHALAGKEVWLEDIASDGVGRMWAKGPDARFVSSDGRLNVRPDGAVTWGDLAHVDPRRGGYVLNGREDHLIKVDGVTVYPNEAVAALRAIPGVLDARVSVDRTGAADRLTVMVIGDVGEAEVRQACAAAPVPITPYRVVIHASDREAFNERGKVVL